MRLFVLAFRFVNSKMLLKTPNQMHDFKKLNVWNEAIKLVTEIYEITEKFPRMEVYGISNQIRRSAISIPSNIAEGSGRKSSGSFKLFLSYSYGSCCELETQLIIAKNINYIEENILNRLIEKISVIEKMLTNLSKSII